MIMVFYLTSSWSGTRFFLVFLTQGSCEVRKGGGCGGVGLEVYVMDVMDVMDGGGVGRW
jgi:hypothetical protein